MDALELTNRLRAEAVQVSESGLPLEVFPQKVQEIIFNLAAYENFNIEYPLMFIDEWFFLLGLQIGSVDSVHLLRKPIHHLCL